MYLIGKINWITLLNRNCCVYNRRNVIIKIFMVPPKYANNQITNGIIKLRTF